MSAEGPIEQAGGSEEQLAVFRREVVERALSERSRPTTTGTLLEAVDVRELTDADRGMWERVKNFSTSPFSLQEFNAYRAHALANGNRSRTNFVGFLATIITPLIARENLEGLGDN